MKKIKGGIRNKLHEALIYLNMGEYDDVENTLKETKEAISGLGNSMRKELEGRFIHNAIKHSEKHGHNAPLVIGQRKRLGKLYQVSIIVTEIHENN